MAMRFTHAYLSMMLLALFASCAVPKNSHRQFAKPKYKVRTHAKDGQPSVAQTWWSSLWFWQRDGGKSRARGQMRLH